MKVISFILFCFIITFASNQVNAQIVKVVSSEYQADIKVYKVSSEYQADLLVYKVKSEYQAKGNEGKWYFTDKSYGEDIKIYYVNSEYQADLKIAFVSSEYRAKWKNEKKKNLVDVD